MFKYFAIHVFFTPVWDFTSAFLTGVKSDRLDISLRLECVNNIRNLCGDQSEFTSLHCGLLKWNHTCNHPLSLDLVVNIWKRKERQRKKRRFQNWKQIWRSSVTRSGPLLDVWRLLFTAQIFKKSSCVRWSKKLAEQFFTKHVAEPLKKSSKFLKVQE